MPKALVVRRVLEHPSFGFPCARCTAASGRRRDAGTSAPPAGSGSQRWWRRVAAATIWRSSSGSRAAADGAELLCGVLRAAGSRATGAGERAVQRTRRAAQVSRADGSMSSSRCDGVVPFPTFGVCRREGCERLADDRLGLCRQCEKVWRHRGRPELARVLRGSLTCSRRWRRSRRSRWPGCREQLRLELLFVAQQFSVAEAQALARGVARSGPRRARRRGRVAA